MEHVPEVCPRLSATAFLRGLTNFTELSPCWEATGCVATQELPSILWNLKVHYHACKSPPLVPVLIQINPVHTTGSYLSTTHLHLGLPSGLFPSGFPTNILYAFLFSSSIRATYPAHLSLHDLIILVILGEEYKLQSSSLCSFLQPILSLHLSLVQIFSSVPCSQTPYVRDQVSHPYRTTGKISISYIPIFMFFNSRREDKKVLESMVTSITQIHSLLNNNFDLLLSFPNIWTVPHFQSISVGYLYIMILPCILVMRQQHTLNLLCIYFYTNLLTSIN
jgi:hypothetical protein